MKPVIVEGLLADIDGVRRGQVRIENGVVVAVGAGLGEPDHVFGDGCLVFAGMGDIHVHARQDVTGRDDYKETFATASAAALHGGVVHVADMPNNPAAPVDDATEAVELPIDWGTELPKADVAAGKQVATKCQSCHNLDQGGPNMTGPNLWGVLGRQPGTHPGFAYSDGMKAFGAKQPIWDYDHINTFITAPGKFIDGTKMTFVGLKQRQDRINVIAYLHTLGSTLPIPKPNPAAAAPAAPASGAPASGAPAAGAPASGAPAASSAAASSAATATPPAK